MHRSQTNDKGVATCQFSLPSTLTPVLLGYCDGRQRHVVILGQFRRAGRGRRRRARWYRGSAAPRVGVQLAAARFASGRDVRGDLFIERVGVLPAVENVPQRAAVGAGRGGDQGHSLAGAGHHDRSPCSAQSSRAEKFLEASDADISHMRREYLNQSVRATICLSICSSAAGMRELQLSRGERPLNRLRNVRERSFTDARDQNFGRPANPGSAV
jgi:hypothetical protein